MGRLAGFSAADVIRKLRRAGFGFDRQAGGSHQSRGVHWPLERANRFSRRLTRVKSTKTMTVAMMASQ